MSSRAVTSLTNPTVKAVRALHMRKEREESGLFLAEGLKIVIEAIDCGHAPKILMYGRDAPDHAWRSNDTVERFAAALRDHLTPTGHALVVLSTDAEQGIVASATQDGFVTGAADQNVVTIATVDKQLWTRVAEIHSGDDVITAQAVDLENIVLIVVLDNDLARQALDCQRVTDKRQRDIVGSAGSIDHDGIMLAVGACRPR